MATFLIVLGVLAVLWALMGPPPPPTGHNPPRGLLAPDLPAPRMRPGGYRDQAAPAVPPPPQPGDPCTMCARAGYMHGCVRTCALEEYQIKIGRKS